MSIEWGLARPRDRGGGVCVGRRRTAPHRTARAKATILGLVVRSVHRPRSCKARPRAGMSASLWSAPIRHRIDRGGECRSCAAGRGRQRDGGSQRTRDDGCGWVVVVSRARQRSSRTGRTWRRYGIGAAKGGSLYSATKDGNDRLARRWRSRRRFPRGPSAGLAHGLAPRLGGAGQSMDTRTIEAHS